MKYLLSFVSVILLVAACGDNVEKHNVIDANGKMWGGFEQGSYWIFRNDSTLELADTISYTGAATNNLIVYDSTGNKMYVNDRLQTSLAQLTYRESGISHSFETTIYVDAAKKVIFSENYCSLHFAVRNVEFCYDSGGKIIEDSVRTDEFMRKVQLLDSITVNGTTYKDVIYIKSVSLLPDETIYNEDASVSYITYLNTYEYWIAKRHWIVKKVLRCNEKKYAWSLVATCIVQSE